MTYRIQGLDPVPFRSLFGLSDAALVERGVRRYVADEKPGFPDRITLRDAEPGQSVLLVNHTHQPAAGPYRSSHAVFVLEGATAMFDAVDTVPEVLRPRMLSLRAFDRDHMIIDADLVDGREVESLIERLLAHERTDYIHAHYAKRGCYACRIERA